MALKAEKMNEKDMLFLLRKKYTRIRPGTTADRYVRAEHVRNLVDNSIYHGHAERILDYLVIDTYGDTEVLGFEVKVSRSDWLKELQDKSKSESWRKHCHRFYLVVSDVSIVNNDLPDGWGLIALGKNGELRVRKQSDYNASPCPLNPFSQAQLYRSVAKTSMREAVDELDGVIHTVKCGKIISKNAER